MEYVDLVNKIVAAEHSAQEIAREAKERRESLDADLARDVAEMREDYLARARRRIAQVSETEQAAAKEDMARWDQKLEQAMSEVEHAYAKSRDEWVDILFHRIIGA